ncbi:MAG: diguanylate cyclase [Chloroflexi bacterium]|nr:diguanylate cyclase [Chloroflexota bacterium]
MIARPSAGEWIGTYPAEIMVCDADGIILEMNAVSGQIYEQEGGLAMIGRNVFDHHLEPARSQMMNVVKQKRHVLYTTEKDGLKKLISIAPWQRDGEYAGFALIVLDLPKKIPNIVKDRVDLSGKTRI